MAHVSLIWGRAKLRLEPSFGFGERSGRRLESYAYGRGLRRTGSAAAEQEPLLNLDDISARPPLAERLVNWINGINAGVRRK